MGIISSIFRSSGSYSRIYKMSPEVRSWRARFEILNLTECEVGMLYQVFLDSDVAEKNVVNTNHLTAYLKVEKNLFARRMLSSFQNGVRFEGFVFEIWSLCTIEENDLGESRELLVLLFLCHCYNVIIVISSSHYHYSSVQSLYHIRERYT